MEKKDLQLLLQVATVLWNGSQRCNKYQREEKKKIIKIKQRKWEGKCDHCQRQRVLAGSNNAYSCSEGMCIIICQGGELLRAGCLLGFLLFEDVFAWEEMAGLCREEGLCWWLAKMGGSSRQGESSGCIYSCCVRSDDTVVYVRTGEVTYWLIDLVIMYLTLGIGKNSAFKTMTWPTFREPSTKRGAFFPLIEARHIFLLLAAIYPA